MASQYNFTHFRTSHLVEDAKATIRLNGPKPGTMAPDFELRDVHDAAWSLRAHRGTPLLLHFGSYT